MSQGTPKPIRSVTPSVQQRDFWLMHRSDVTKCTYQLAVLVEAEGTIDVASLRTALMTVGARNATLRTSFESDGGNLICLQWDIPDVSVVTELPSEELPNCHLIARRPIDLGAPTVLRLVLFPGGPGRFLLLVVSHHICLDGAALDQLVVEMLECCAGLDTPARPDYEVFVVDQLLARRAALSSGVRHWRSVLAGREAGTETTLREDPTRGEGMLGGAVRLRVVHDQARLIRAAAMRNHTSLFAWFGSIIVNCCLPDPQLGGVGIPIDARTRERCALGPYVLTAPLALAASYVLPRDLQLEVATAFDYIMVSALSDGPGDSGLPKFRMVLNGLQRYPSPYQVGVFRILSSEPISTGAKAELAVTIEEAGPELILRASFRDSSRTEKYVEALRDAASAAAGHEMALQAEMWDLIWSSHRTRDGNVLARTGSTEFSAGEIEAFYGHIGDRLTGLGRAENLDVVEVGCGEGRVTELYAGAFRSWIALDVSPTGVEQARRRTSHLGDRAPAVICGDALYLRALRPASVDIVLLIGVTQFFPDRQYLDHVLRASAVALRAGGTVLVLDLPSPEGHAFESGLLLDLSSWQAMAAEHFGEFTVLPRTGVALPESLLERHDVQLGRPLAGGVLTPPERTDDAAPSEFVSVIDAARVDVSDGASRLDIISGVCEQELGRYLDADEDFFSAGGTSLRAARVTARLRNEFGMRLMIRDFFRDKSSPRALSQAEASRWRSLGG